MRGLTFLMVLIILLLSGPAAPASPYSVSNEVSFTDFETFGVGDTINQYTDESLRGQTWSADDEWVGSAGTFDEEIVAAGGNQGWRISDALGSGGYAGKPWSPSIRPVGEPGSHLWNDRGSDSANPLDPPNPNGSGQVPVFSASFDFWSVTGATQDNLIMSVSPGPRQSRWRQSYLGLDADDDTPGIDIFFYETDANGDFVRHQVATALNASIPHNVRMEILFRDGLNGDGSGNDEVEIYIDDILALDDVTTWESSYILDSTTPDQIAVDSLLFNVSGIGTETAGNGFVFDNVWLETIPEPSATLLLALALALAGMLGMRRRARNTR